MSNERRRLLAAIDASQSAAVRLRLSLSDDRALLELAARDGEEVSSDTLRAADAFVQRFQQIFEHFIHRLYPSIYRVESEGDRPPHFVALLTRMEETGVTRDARRWAQRAELRNRLVHEYPLDPIERTATFLGAIEEATDMLAELDLALDYIKRRQLASDGNSA